MCTTGAKVTKAFRPRGTGHGKPYWKNIILQHLQTSFAARQRISMSHTRDGMWHYKACLGIPFRSSSHLMNPKLPPEAHVDLGCTTLLNSLWPWLAEILESCGHNIDQRPPGGTQQLAEISNLTWSNCWFVFFFFLIWSSSHASS